MTRKDYVLIAATIAKSYTATFELLSHDDYSVVKQAQAELQGMRNLTYNLAAALGDDNPRFDNTRFIQTALTQRNP